jgi:hypothetical protein
MLSFTEVTTCRLRRFVAKKYYKIVKPDGKSIVGWWMLVSEEELDNEDSFVFEHHWPLTVPEGYVDIKNGVCTIKNAKCWALRLDLDRIAITFSDNYLKSNILTAPELEYFDYNYFKNLFREED